MAEYKKNIKKGEILGTRVPPFKTNSILVNTILIKLLL